ncbi:hypothetical protein MTP04_14220 [Lysinibacillus sp. PLM2]|nr:hypothetical protein MTP04_14220 [Lysinibacillus sp. PLM2]
MLSDSTVKGNIEVSCSGLQVDAKVDDIMMNFSKTENVTINEDSIAEVI